MAIGVRVLVVLGFVDRRRDQLKTSGLAQFDQSDGGVRFEPDAALERSSSGRWMTQVSK